MNSIATRVKNRKRKRDDMTQAPESDNTVKMIKHIKRDEQPVNRPPQTIINIPAPAVITIDFAPPRHARIIRGACRHDLPLPDCNLCNGSNIVQIIEDDSKPNELTVQEDYELNLAIVLSTQDVPPPQNTMNSDEEDCAICMDAPGIFKYDGCKCNVALCASCASKTLTQVLTSPKNNSLNCLICRQKSYKLVQK